ncbi:unnamed protein product [Ilex paraguariensis]|uniref:Glycosyltransferase 61 catalytic domain-containing protein n=1 Tax=Ilex paraguariensis TaxID=185542 RepID=A0ABC8RBM8_9AQUA
MAPCGSIDGGRFLRDAAGSQAMKEKGPTTLAICLMVLIFVFLLDITFKISISSVTYSKRTEDKTISEQNLSKQRSKVTEPIKCDRSHYEYDVCYLNRSTVLDPTTATLSAVDPTNSTPRQLEKIRPYPRKWQNQVMSLIRELTLTTAPPNTSCAIIHRIPALVFSAGGYTGNFLHDFNDGFIPLFLTVNSLLPNQEIILVEIILVVVNCNEGWLLKYAKLLHRFTSHPIINLDDETITHCFPSATVGLISHGPMTVNPTLLPGPHSKSILDFRALLATTYSQSHELPSKQLKARPQLVMVSRESNRRILNQDDVQEAAEDVGFDVVIFEPTHKTPLHEAFRLIDASHAMMGVHGAGLTHELFLRPGAVFMQVVPIGFDWLAEICFGKLAISLGLEYIEYDIEAQESSLMDKYARDSLELSNPGAILNGNWSKMGTYLTQDVKLDLVRTRKYLEKAYKKARKFMLRESLYVE